ncbi:hypothetical protein DYB32_004695 [Aphanomyces invadans]|uniref:Uncharacterized protein n=1 Tax=Aphanomyces invadans TaxID=157072 RepID=A0A3R6Y9A1_9STRA|nr:hypothetical protein DYB32_004695 [Aphanomyces invadans]
MLSPSMPDDNETHHYSASGNAMLLSSLLNPMQPSATANGRVPEAGDAVPSTMGPSATATGRGTAPGDTVLNRTGLSATATDGATGVTLTDAMLTLMDPIATVTDAVFIRTGLNPMDPIATVTNAVINRTGLNPMDPSATPADAMLNRMGPSFTATDGATASGDGAIVESYRLVHSAETESKALALGLSTMGGYFTAWFQLADNVREFATKEGFEVVVENSNSRTRWWKCKTSDSCPFKIRAGKRKSGDVWNLFVS